MTTTNDPTPEARLVDVFAPDNLARDYDDGTAEEAFADFMAEDASGATWAARKIARIERRTQEIRGLFDDQVARLEAWYTHETEGLERDRRFFAGRLEGFHRRALELDPKAKTIRLPDGTELRSSAGRLSVEVTDLDKFVAWVDEHELVGLVELGDPKPQKAKIAAAFAGKAQQETEPGSYPAVVDDGTGETVPGIEIVRKPRSFTAATPEG